MVKKRAELARLHDVYNTMLKNSGCDMFEGRATVVDPHTVEVAGKRYTVCASCDTTANPKIYQYKIT